MLLRKDALEGIARGEIDVAFRWWTRPTVKAGGTLQTSVGQLAIASVEPTTPSAVTVEDARRAGFPSRAALLRAFPRKPGSRLYRVELSLAGRTRGSRFAHGRTCARTRSRSSTGDWLGWDRGRGPRSS